jgi:hypothetical protein
MGWFQRPRHIVRARWRHRRAAADLASFTAIYGAFLSAEDVTAMPITGLDKESGQINRFIVELVDRLRASSPITPLLLAGEPAGVRSAYEAWLDLEGTQITTAGLGDVDVLWDYETNPPPSLGGFRLILSQSMLEHLIDPYRHLRDLAGLLADGGSIIVTTHTPGFDYHRYPIDSLRFYPDFFETVAERLGLNVTGRLVADGRIAYQLTRPFDTTNG